MCVHTCVYLWVCIHTTHTHIYVCKNKAKCGINSILFSNRVGFSFSIYCFECSNRRAYCKSKAQTVKWLHNWVSALLSWLFCPSHCALIGQLLKHLRKLRSHLWDYKKGPWLKEVGNTTEVRAWPQDREDQEQKRGVSAAEGASTELWFQKDVRAMQMLNVCALHGETAVPSHQSVHTEMLFKRQLIVA